MRKPLAIAAVLAAVAALCCAAFVREVRADAVRFRRRRAMADMRELAAAVVAQSSVASSYDFGPSPARLAARDATLSYDTTSMADLRHVTPAELRAALVPTYARRLPERDPWGGVYDVAVAGDRYVIRTFGSDHRPDGETYTHGRVKNEGDDLVLADGTFARFEGTEQ